MGRYDARGYAFGAGKPIDLTQVGYSYNNGQYINNSTVNRNKDMYELEMGTYYNSSGNLCLKFGPINRYCLAFQLYFSGHYGNNYTNGLNTAEYKVIVTPTSDNLQ